MRKQTTPVTRMDPERHVLCPSDCFSHAYWCCPRVCPGPFCFSLSGVMPLWFHQFFSGQGTGLIDLTPSNIYCLTKKEMCLDWSILSESFNSWAIWVESFTWLMYSSCSLKYALHILFDHAFYPLNTSIFLSLEYAIVSINAFLCVKIKPHYSFPSFTQMTRKKV